MSFNIRKIIIVALIISTTALAAESESELTGKITADADGSLIFNSAGRQIKTAKILSPAGDLELVTFNGGPALNYISDASSTSFDVSYTLRVSDNKIKIDCAYADIRSHINGAIIRKSVCGLNKEVDEETYLNIFSYSDNWQEAAEKLEIKRVLDNPTKYTQFLIEKTSNSSIYQKYNKSMLLDGETITLLSKDGKILDFGKKTVYIVYNPKGKAYALDVLKNKDTTAFQRINID